MANCLNDMDSGTKNVLITGASGFIGKALVHELKSSGYKVSSLSASSSNPEASVYRWDPIKQTTELPEGVLFDAVIHLAGASIAEMPWNRKGKTKIMESRVQSTLYLNKLISGFKAPPEHIVSASAIGYYGFTGQEPKTESDPPGDDFAAQVAFNWEQTAARMDRSPSHLSILRIGIVLGNSGGFYHKLKMLKRFNLAAPLGTGLQPVCWIHLEDMVQLFCGILSGKIAPGIYNAVAGCASNKEITRAIARHTGQFILLPAVPSIIIRLLYGEKSGILLHGCPVSNQKLTHAGMKFKFTNMQEAILSLEP